MANYWLSFLCMFVFFSSLCNISHASTKAEILTLEKLKQIRAASKVTYDFIILMKQLLIDEDSLIVDQTLLPAEVPQKIHYYYCDCSDKTLLTVCQIGRNVPIILVYKRAIIEYEKGWGNKNQIISKSSDQINNMKQNVKKWVKQVMSSSVEKDIKQRSAIEQIIQENKSVFVMVHNKTIGQQDMAFDLMAKFFPSEKFVYYTDQKIAQTLDMNLTEGKFIHFTYDGQQNQFPNVATPKFEQWKSFVQNQLFWGIEPLSAEVTSDRFNLTKVLTKPRETLVFCDLTFECISFMKKLNEEIIDAKSKGQDIKVIKNIVQSQSFKNPKILQLYYHVKLSAKSMPAVMVINGEDQNYPNIPARYLNQLNKQNSPLAQIKKVWGSIDQNTIKAEFLSSGTPKKNGYYGKGSERHIQKLSFETYKKAILAAHKQGQLYLLYITAFDFQCPKCEQSYSQFKKFASFVISDGWTNVKFGVFDLSKNQIDLSSIQGIPSLLFFKPGSIDPVTLKDSNQNDKINIFKARFDFDSLHRYTEFYRKQLAPAQNVNQEL